MFLSNIDNMGATVDFNILNLCVMENHEFIMEVTKKTRADVKGGTLINYENRLRLLEVAQVSKDHLEDFKSVKKFDVFNTNNLWIHLPGTSQLSQTGVECFSTCHYFPIIMIDCVPIASTLLLS